MKNNVYSIAVLLVFIGNSCYGMESFSKQIEGIKSRGPVVIVESYFIDENAKVSLGKYVNIEDTYSTVIGFMQSDDDHLDTCALRLIREATNIQDVTLRQYKCTSSFLSLNDTMQSVLGFSYIATNMRRDVQSPLGEAAWFGKDELPSNIKSLCVSPENIHSHIKAMIADVQEEKAKSWWELKKVNPDIMVTAFLLRENKLFNVKFKRRQSWQCLMDCMKRTDKSLESCAERLVLEQTGMQACNFKVYGTPSVVERMSFLKPDNSLHYSLVSRDISGEAQSLENTFDACEWSDIDQLNSKTFSGSFDGLKIGNLFSEIDELKHCFFGSSVIIINGKNQVLLVQEKGIPGVWHIPFALCKNKHTTYLDAIREGFKKDLGMTAYNLQISSVMQSRNPNVSEDTYTTTFFTRSFSGEPQLGESSSYSEYAWFDVHNLPSQLEISGCSRDQLYNLLHYKAN